MLGLLRLLGLPLLLVVVLLPEVVLVFQAQHVSPSFSCEDLSRALGPHQQEQACQRPKPDHAAALVLEVGLLRPSQAGAPLQ